MENEFADETEGCMKLTDVSNVTTFRFPSASISTHHPVSIKFCHRFPYLKVETEKKIR